MENKKNIYTTIKTVIFYILTIFLLAYVTVSLFIPDKVIDIFGFQLTTISRATESMTPTIEPGDIILLKKVSKDDIEEDDIISFYNYARGINQNNEEVWIKIRIVHRIIEVEDDGSYITQGDNNNSVDTIYDENGNVTDLTYDQVIGAYVFRMPIIGDIVTGLRNPVLVGLLIINVGIVVLIVKLIKKKDDSKIEKNKEEDESNDLG